MITKILKAWKFIFSTRSLYFNFLFRS